MDSERRCWICLGSGKEPPPLGTSRDAEDWVKPCSCSLEAHRKCLLEWVSCNNLEKEASIRENLGLRSNEIGFHSVNFTDNYSVFESGRGAFRPFFNYLDPTNLNGQAFMDSETDFDTSSISRAFAADVDSETLSRVTEAMSLGARQRHRRGTTLSKKFVINTVCPQCNTPILLRTSREFSLLATSAVCKTLEYSVRNLTLVTVVGTVGSSLLISAVGVLMSAGLRIMTALVPESTLVKLLGLRRSTLLESFSDNNIGFSQIAILAMTPLYLMGFRYQSALLSWLNWIYPLCFLRSNEKLQSNAKRYLLYQYPLAILHEVAFVFVLNPLYFKWVHEVKPYFISDRMTVAQIKLYEEEQRYLEELQSEGSDQTRRPRRRSVLQFIKKKAAVLKIYCGRLILSMGLDYSEAIIPASIWEKIGTTILWPYAGKILGELMMKLRFYRRLVGEHSSTSDDGIYLSNLIGCCLAVILRDAFNLFLTWRRVKQLSSLEVLEYMSPEWDTVMNTKTGQILEDLTLLNEDEDSKVILQEHARRLLSKKNHDQWLKITQGIPNVRGKVNFLRYLVVKQNVYRSAQKK
ncbi:LAMI_0C02542g1_1 [Lachancea mirantina]|uniref:LAMI_0C02542g1_1 n=1 Tax=Lachancea mirantina TaxID=1230905 RepID=A0A1G4J104_9SACH|nr:LAMI_0C02542g1_1 [Lachancea mirantina]